MTALLHDHLDASLQDFENPPLSPASLRHSSVVPSEPTTEDLELDSDAGSAGGYSPPAWRRLGNGDRSSGFWRGPMDNLGGPMRSIGRFSRESSMRLDEESEGENVLDQAIRTRLPRGSISPDKGRSPSPHRGEDSTLRVDQKAPPPAVANRTEPREAPSENCKCMSFDRDTGLYQTNHITPQISGLLSAQKSSNGPSPWKQPYPLSANTTPPQRQRGPRRYSASSSPSSASPPSSPFCNPPRRDRLETSSRWPA